MKIDSLEIERLIEASTGQENSDSAVIAWVEAVVLAAMAVYFVGIALIWTFR